MAYTYSVNGVGLDQIFDLYISGTKAILTGYKVNGVDLKDIFAPIYLGSSAAVTGYKVNGADLNTIFAKKGTAQYSLPIDGQTYSGSVLVPAGNTGSVNVAFKLTSSTAWQVVVTGAGGTLTPPNNTVLASGSLPAGSSTIKYTLTYLAASGDTGPGTATNNASAFTPVATNLSAGVTVGGTGTGSPHQTTYALNVQIRNSAGVVISNSTCTLRLDQEGSA